jgi:pullulanase
MDQNSYNSGDWFNKIDFTCESNNWGTGLPVASENESQWPIMKPLLAKAALKPTSVDIKNTLNAFLGLLRVRYSSGLFRMRSLAEVQSNLSFVESEGGVIEMRLKANTGSYQGYQEILVVFNANTKDALVKTAGLEPHPAISEWGSFDKAGGSANVKALSTAVFVG